MNDLAWTLLAALFLPLFPLSMVFNRLFASCRNPALRTLLLLAWPQAGVVLLAQFDHAPPVWLLGCAVATSLLYALRALALRDVGAWISFLATSAWALLWLSYLEAPDWERLQMQALSFSAPLAMLAVLSGSLERRFGAAYTGLYGGLAQTLPRLAGVLVVVVLAVVATPLFPGFFVMLETVVLSTPPAPFIALGTVLVWLLWSWAGARLLHGLVVGPAGEADVLDLSLGAVWGYTVALGILIMGGLYGLGSLS